jgi:acetyl-CoA carboxylase carboxyl transferase subunit alpha
VPIIVCITGEGGSGGALAVAVGNRVVMLEHSVYAVISPEGCAAILWSDGTKGPQAAEALKPTAQDIIGLGVIDEIIHEPVGGAHRDHEATAQALGSAIRSHLADLKTMSKEELVEDRYQKFRAMTQMAE